MNRKVLWFDRGRDAFTEGKPCIITDARISGKDRQDWFAGWLHQKNLNAKEAPEDARVKAIASLKAIRESLA